MVGKTKLAHRFGKIFVAYRLGDIQSAGEFISARHFRWLSAVVRMMIGIWRVRASNVGRFFMWEVPPSNPRIAILC